MRDYHYYQSVFAGIPKPFAFVDLDHLEENAQQIVLQSNGKSIRIASKSIRSVAVLKRLLQVDESFSGIMCYSAPEALHLCAAGFDDLLLGSDSLPLQACQPAVCPKCSLCCRKRLQS